MLAMLLSALAAASSSAVVSIDEDNQVRIVISLPADSIGDPADAEAAGAYVRERYTWFANGTQGPSDETGTTISAGQVLYRAESAVPFEPGTLGFSHDFGGQTLDVTFQFPEGDNVSLDAAAGKTVSAELP